MFICSFVDYVVMLNVTQSPEWDETFIMYDVLEGSGRAVIIAPCKVHYMYVCGVIEENKETCQTDWYADQYLNTIQCDHIVCNTEDFS